MSKLTIAAISLTTLGSTLLAPVAQCDDLKIAVVDTQRVLNDSVLGKAARSTLEGDVKKGQARLEGLKAEFEKETQGLQKQASVLSPSALEQRREALSKKEVEIQRAYQDLQAKLQRENDSEISKVVKEIDAVVKEIAADGEYTAVLEKNKQSVVFASERVDITPQVIQALDKRKVGL